MLKKPRILPQLALWILSGVSLAAAIGYSPSNAELKAIASEAEVSPQLVAQSAPLQVTVQDLEGFNGAITALALSPDGKTLLVAAGDGTITAVNLEDSQSAYSQSFKINDFSNLAFSPDGQFFAAADREAIAVFGADRGEKLKTLQGHAGKVSALAISPDSKTLVSVSGEDRTIRVWDLDSGDLIKTIGKDIGPVTEVTFSPDGQYFVTGSIGNSRYLKFWDASSLELMKTYPQQAYIYGVGITPDGKKLLAAVKNYVKAWDIATGRELWTRKVTNLDLNMLAISPDSRLVATANKEGTITLLDINTGRQVTVLKGHEGWVLSLAFSPDGKYLYSGAEDKLVKIWQLFP